MSRELTQTGVSGPGRAGYRPHLDGIRAAAVVLVIGFHLGISWLPGGFIGVDVFFVLSGYLITGLLATEATAAGGVRLGRFYARRVRRLLPASVVVLIAVMAASIWLLDVVQRQAVGQDATAAALYGANWRFATVGGDYFAPGDVPSPLVHYWSLAVEEQFYVLWPALFLVAWKVSTRRRGPSAIGGLLAVIGAAAVVSAVASLVLTPSATTYYGTHIRAYQLLAGAGLAVAARRWDLRFPDSRAGRRLAAAAAVGAALALVALAHSIADARDYPGRAGLAVTAASLALVAALDLAPVGVAQRVAGHPFPAAVGRLSYSLYIWHWPVIVFAPLVAARWAQPRLGTRPAMLGVTVLLAGACYLLVERPVRFRLGLAAPARAVVAVGLVLSVLVGVSGVPLLRPRDAFAAKALGTVRDLAKPGHCPYFTEDWPSPAESEPCLYRDGGPRVLALVGDSHAQQWQPAIERIADEEDLTVIRLTRGGCPANDITAYARDQTGRNVADRDCVRWRHAMYRRLIVEHDPDVVFVATRSHVRGIRHAGRDVAPTDPGHVELWSTGWDWTLDTLSAGGAQVVVSEILPTLPRRVPACLIAAGKGTATCDFAVAGDTAVVPYNEVIRGLAARPAGVAVVDPTPIGCPAGICPAMMNGIIVHRDDNHLSATFVRAHSAAFRALLGSGGVDL